MDTLEHFFNCPYCGEKISMVLDTSAESQSYVEDCEVCCNPIDVSYEVQGDKVMNFRAERTDE